MKIKQIAVALNAEEEMLYALGEDGCLYQKNGRSVKTDAGGYQWLSWWEIVDMPIGDPEGGAR
jgi:hypothetical protein